MITLENTLEVQRTPKEVFAFLVTVENAPKWQPAVIQTKRGARRDEDRDRARGARVRCYDGAVNRK